MRDPSALITEAHARVREAYGAAVGRQDVEAVTPALIVDRSVVTANLSALETRLPDPARAACGVTSRTTRAPTSPGCSWSTARSACAPPPSGRRS